MSSAAKRYMPNYTVEEYQAWDGEWELIDGIPIAMSPAPFARHQACATKVARIFGNELERVGCGCTVIMESDWIVDNHTVVRPDVVIVCDGIPEQYVKTPPALIVEVLSPSTAQHDRTIKFDLYQDHGVGYYLIVDVDQEMIDVFALRNGKFVRWSEDTICEFQLSPKCCITWDTAKLF